MVVKRNQPQILEYNHPLSTPLLTNAEFRFNEANSPQLFFIDRLTFEVCSN